MSSVLQATWLKDSFVSVVSPTITSPPIGQIATISGGISIPISKYDLLSKRTRELVEDETSNDYDPSLCYILGSLPSTFKPQQAQTDSDQGGDIDAATIAFRQQAKEQLQTLFQSLEGSESFSSDVIRSVYVTLLSRLLVKLEKDATEKDIESIVDTAVGRIDTNSDGMIDLLEKKICALRSQPETFSLMISWLAPTRLPTRRTNVVFRPRMWWTF